MADAGAPHVPSRYHSQRRQQPSVDETPTSPVDGDGVARSKSRYRRKQGNSAGPDNPLPDLPPANTPSRYHSKHRQSPLNTLYKEQVVDTSSPAHRTSAGLRHHELPQTAVGALGPRTFSSDGPASGRDTERRITSRERLNNRHQPEPLQQSPPPSQPTGELFPPPKPAFPPKIDGPPQSGNIRATKSMTELPKYDEDDTGCFGGLFKRKRGDAPTSAAQKTTIGRPKNAKDNTIKPGGGGTVPGLDAPVSAINSGERSVLVESGKVKTLFPVSPTTTSADIIKSASTCIPGRIDLKSAILLEDFVTVGVQRPLRRYETVRDVLNSWDNDRQNILLLVDPGTGTLEPELTMTGVPRMQPEEQSWMLSYSQKPGKWDKRFITLRTSGQIVCQKDPEKAKDTVNVCHLSDFDIYTPTPEKLKKKIKPPKKFCFAVKSQQKSNVFLSTENFVHFFSTADRATADSFHNAIQRWRSWYLVNVKGAGKKEKSEPAKANDRSAGNDHVKSHRKQESADAHYQLGSFQPMMDAGAFDERPSSSKSDRDRFGSSNMFAKSANQFDVNVSPERRTSTAKRQHPPLSSLNNKAQLAEDEPLANLNRQASTSKRRSSTDQRRPDPAEFKDTGLLGRNYSQRRKEQAEREDQRNEPFATGPNLLNGGGDSLGMLGDGLRRNPSTRKHASNQELKRSSSTRDGGRNGHARTGSGDLERSGSRRQKPKPLVDLTPQFREPPQHLKKGRGFHPDQVNAGGLIANATTPEDPLGLPVATVFRNTSGTHSGQNSPGLIDLTPQHQEPIHHARKGRGYKPETGAGGTLVGNATSPDDPLGLPQNNVFRSLNAMPEGRRRAGSVTDAAQPVQRRLSVSRSPEGFTGEGLLGASQKRAVSQPQRRLSVSKSPEGFTGEGLLGASSNRQGWGTETKGRGVIDGSRAGGKPLVDLTETSRFVHGSLLNKVEKAEGIPPPIIDREKRNERNEKYGEGY